MRRTAGAGREAGGGFTLAEVAVTIVIVGIGLILVLQGLNTAKMAAAQTRNIKLARELALLTLGQIESGLFQDDIEHGLQGTYADQGYPAFSYEVAVGDQTLQDRDPNAPHDSWVKPIDTQNTDEEEDVEQPFEKVKIRIAYPKFAEYVNESTFERWIPWEQVYGSAEDGKSKSSKASTGGSTAGSSTSGSGTSGSKTP